MTDRKPHKGTLRRRDFLAGAAAASTGLIVRPQMVWAQWPEKPIDLSIMYAAGGGTDVVLRVLAQEMAKLRDWPLEVSNRPGAVGGIATDYVLRQPADGYTWLGAANYNKYVRVMGHSDSVPWRDWAVFQAAHSLAAWSVPTDSEFETLEDVVAYAKENPGELTVSTSGTGGLWHELALIVSDALGIRVQFIPYKGGKPATLAGLQGETMIAGGGVHEHVDLVRDGQLRMLQQTGAEDIKLADGTVLPSIGNFVPELKPNLPIGGVYNLMLRRETPTEILREVGDAFSEAVDSDAFQEVAKKQYFQIEYQAGADAARRGALLETITTDLFNRYSDQIGAEVRSADELGLPTPDTFDKWWPPKGFEPVEL